MNICRYDFKSPARNGKQNSFHRCFVNCYRYDFKSPATNGDLKSYRQMFTKHRWHVLNTQWHPVDGHPTVTTTLTRSSLYKCITFCFTNATTLVIRPRPQSSCYKAANRAPRNTGVPNHSQTMYPFSSLTDKHVPLKLLMTKSRVK